MKRMFAKQSLMSLVAGFFFFGLLLTANRSEAQINWKLPADAQQAIVTEMGNVNAALNANAPGTPAHTNALIHAYYYKGIHVRISEGNTVAEAVTKALDVFPMTTGGPMTVGQPAGLTAPVDKAKRSALLADAQALLQQ